MATTETGDLLPDPEDNLDDMDYDPYYIVELNDPVGEFPEFDED